MTGPSYFFCGIGGSGMSALAVLLHRQGHAVAGSDRSFDQGQTPEKFKRMLDMGITLHPQDGSGVTAQTSVLVVSSAIEESIPDVAAARRLGVPIKKRAGILAELFNGRRSVGVGGTSGKTTVTGIAGWVFKSCGADPLVVNGGVMLNVMDNIYAGQGEWIVAEMDESDGSIALFTPDIAILNNITLDHKPIAELRGLFGDFVDRARLGAVINLDDPEAATLRSKAKQVLLFSTTSPDADLVTQDIVFTPTGSTFTIVDRRAGTRAACRLNVPGLHNISNALAAAGAALLAGFELHAIARALEGFKGIHRRLETVGTANGITVIDDFAHNPDKIAASLATLRQSGGRLLVMFQPHGFGPMRMMRKELTEAFAEGMGADDILLMPEIFYAGGTTVRDISSADLIDDVRKLNRKAEFMQTREDVRTYIRSHAKTGDRIVIMGARDDTLPEFAKSLLLAK